MYAGSYSLSKELKKINIKNIQIGDIFIKGGFPGHAVIVLDAAKNENGDIRFVIGQSYMPAQDIHVLKNPQNRTLSPWYSINLQEQLVTPEYYFDWNDLRRFE